MDEMVCKSEKRLVVTFQVSSVASSRNSLVGASSMSADSCQRWCAPKVAANSFHNTFIGNASSPRISTLPQVLP